MKNYATIIVFFTAICFSISGFCCSVACNKKTPYQVEKFIQEMKDSEIAILGTVERMGNCSEGACPALFEVKKFRGDKTHRHEYVEMIPIGSRDICGLGSPFGPGKEYVIHGARRSGVCGTIEVSWCDMLRIDEMGAEDKSEIETLIKRIPQHSPGIISRLCSIANPVGITTPLWIIVTFVCISILVTGTIVIIVKKIQKSRGA